MVNNRFLQWAAWNRRGVLIKTNNHVESYHNILKKGSLYLNRQVNARLDFLIHVLTVYAEHTHRRWILKQYNYESSFRIKNIHADHKKAMRALKLKSHEVFATKLGQWKCKSSENHVYTVK